MTGNDRKKAWDIAILLVFCAVALLSRGHRLPGLYTVADCGDDCDPNGPSCDPEARQLQTDQPGYSWQYRFTDKTGKRIYFGYWVLDTNKEHPAVAEYDPSTGKYNVKTPDPSVLFPSLSQATNPPWPNPLDALLPKLKQFVQAAAPPVIRLYKTDGNNDALVVFDTQTNKLVKRIPVGKHPNGVAVSPDLKFALVANQQASSVSIVDLNTLAVAGTVSLPASNPMWIGITPDSLFAYVTNGMQTPGAVHVIDITKRTVASSIPVGGLPIKLAVTPDGTQVWVANSLDKTVSIVDTLTNTVFKTLTVDTGTLGVAFNANGTRAYVTGGTTLNVIDPATYAVIAKVTVGSYPIGITVDPDNGDIWVANRLSAFVSRINGYTNKLIENMPAQADSIAIVPVY